MSNMDHIFQNPEFGEPWFSYPNLYSLVVRDATNGSKFVEVGSRKGKSSSFMCVEIANSMKRIEFYCVDTWEGSAEHQETNAADLPELYKLFLRNMEPVQNYYVPLRMTSLDASLQFEDKSLDFVFIDAAHDYASVLLDIDAWMPKVKPGGILAGHDYTPSWPGVVKAVNERFKHVVCAEDCWAVEIL